MNKNFLKEIRVSLMISKAKLARKANISDKTISRIENGMPCRIATQRRIVLALGYKISDMDKVFGSDMGSWKDNKGRRSGVDRRQFEYNIYIPEKRSYKERRNGFDRRKKPRTSE
ncbi:MAG: helix-turn-helix transcriptional regulator [Desulfobacterales bacterium]